MNIYAETEFHRIYKDHSALTVQVKADFAMFTRPGNPLNRATYAFPTPSALRGMLKTIYHSPALYPLPVKVEVLNPITKKSIAQTMSTCQRFVAPSRKGGIYSPLLQGERADESNPHGGVYLCDVEYRISYDVWFVEWKKFDKLKARLNSGPDSVYGIASGDSSPYLGTKECATEFVPVDSRPGFEHNYAYESNMFIGLETREVAMEKGVVVYPKETLKLLWHRRNDEIKRQVISVEKDID